MRSTASILALLFAGATLLLACSSTEDSTSGTTPDASPQDASDTDTIAPQDSMVDTAPDVPDPPDAPAEAGPTSCELPCTQACATHGPMQGDCETCVSTVCGDYRTQAEQAPNREALFDCIEACGTDASCPNACCNKYATACAWEGAYEMCTCGFPEDDCSNDCVDNCGNGVLTETCGVCASQSPCSFATFTYLFAPKRAAHQDCVATCASSTLSRDECLDLCRNDHPEAAAAYDDYIACVCE
jgi:hypothetical protein